MKTGFLPGDALFEPGADKPRYKVQRYLLEIQRVKVLDLTQKTEVNLDESELRQQIATGQLHVQRAGMFLTSVNANRSNPEDACTLAHLRVLAAIESLRKERGVSLNAAYETLRQQSSAGRRPDLPPPTKPGTSFPFVEAIQERIADTQRQRLEGAS